MIETSNTVVRLIDLPAIFKVSIMLDYPPERDRRRICGHVTSSNFAK